MMTLEEEAAHARLRRELDVLRRDKAQLSLQVQDAQRRIVDLEAWVAAYERLLRQHRHRTQADAQSWQTFLQRYRGMHDTLP